MSHNKKLAVLLLLVGVICVPAVKIWATCYLTLFTTTKCGTDRVLSSMKCGGVLDCKTRELVYDNMSSCNVTSPGLEACEPTDCLQHDIRRECVFNQQQSQWECNLVSDTPLSSGEQRLRATGSYCVDQTEE